MNISSLLSAIPADLPDELSEQIAGNRHLRIERIVSKGHCSPDGFWYDQHEDEWVVLLKGAARLQFEEAAQEVELKPGDHLLIPARCRHRISWTAPGEVTVWLAIFSQEPLA